ncbi:MAG: ABC transporter permease [Alphaproteobacteria bacterium]|nr:MAG: ABC transporter permease [Alphaproteobacteria bacterium]
MVPRPTTILVPADQWPVLNLRELWQHRDLLWMLTWRGIHVRYKQAVIGAGWAILQPLALMAVFSIFFGLIVRIPSDGIAYPLFVYSGLTLWQFTARAVHEGAGAIALNPHLVAKIYLPRLYLPLAAILAAAVDLAASFVALLVMLAIYQVVPGWQVIVLPLVLLLVAATVVGMAAFLAAMWALYRDVAHLLPFLLQVWMFCTPVIYPTSMVPAAWQWVYALNPMVTAVDALRWALLGGVAPTPSMILASTLVALALLVFGYCWFRRREGVMPDAV